MYDLYTNFVDIILKRGWAFLAQSYVVSSIAILNKK